jgi:cytochrome c peroxidase
MMSSGCSRGTPWQWNLPPGFPEPRVPADNPLTQEKVALGRKLFYDERLSANGTQSCASCHIQAHAFGEATATATGSTGEKHHRNSMTLANAAYSSTFTWAHSGIGTLEEHVRLPLFGDRPVEMGAAGHEKEILERIRTDTEYEALFDRAFPWQPGKVSFDNIVKAISSFVRSLVSFESRFDRYAYYGEDAALTESEIRGMNLFMSERIDCDHCHSGFNFSQFVTHQITAPAERTFHVTGLYPKSAEHLSGADYGLFAVTGNIEDQDRFKAPTLRNIAQTAPYMHDGSLATLDEVIDFYAAGGRVVTEGPRQGDGRLHPAKSPFIKGFTLTPAERQDLLAFLSALTDERFLSDPRHGEPPAHFTRRFDSVSQLGFVHRSHFAPTNIALAFLSPLNCHSTQFDATFANSPPPGWYAVAVWPAPCRAP